MKTLNELLKKIGFNDTPLRTEVKNAFKEWLQQKRDKQERKFDEYAFVINELLEELE